MADNRRKLIADGSARGYFENSSLLLNPQLEWTLAFWYRNTSPKRNTNDNWSELDRALISKRMGSNIGTQIYSFQHPSQPYPSNNAVMVFNVGEGTYNNFAPVSSDYMTDATLHANQPDPFDGDWHHVVLRNVNVGGTMMNQLIIDGFNYLKELANMNMAVWSWVEHGMVSGTASNNGQVAVWSNPHNSAQPPAFESGWFADAQEMDEIAIFSKALSDAEVDEIRAANNYAASSVSGDLILFNRAGDGAGDTDTRGEDQSANDYDLILSNGQFGHIDSTESIFSGTVVSAADFASPDSAMTEDFDGWSASTQIPIPESTSDFGSATFTLTEDFSGWSASTQIPIPESTSDFGSATFTFLDDMDWSVAVPSTPDPEINDMAKRLYLKAVAGQGDVLVADLGLKLKDGVSTFVAISDHEALQANEKPIITPSECRSSSSLRALIELDKIEFSFDGTSYSNQTSASEKWSPELLLISDLSDQEIVAARVEAIGDVVGNKVITPEITLAGSDLGGELSGLDTRVDAEETKSATATADRGAIRTEISDLVGAKVGANIAADIVAAENSAKAHADQAEADAISTASADASSKANQALLDAKAYADVAESDAVAAAAITAQDKADQALLDAKDYADTAESDAVAAAALTAQNKADAALAAAQTYADTAEADAIQTSTNNRIAALAAHDQSAAKVSLVNTYDGSSTKITAADGKMESAITSINGLLAALMDDDDAVLSVKAPLYKARRDAGSQGQSQSANNLLKLGQKSSEGTPSGLSKDVEDAEADILVNAAGIAANTTSIGNNASLLATVNGADTLAGSFRKAVKDVNDVLVATKADVDAIKAGENPALDTFKEVNDWLNENVNANASALTSENILPRLVDEETFTAALKASGGAGEIGVSIPSGSSMELVAPGQTKLDGALEAMAGVSYVGGRLLNGWGQTGGMDWYIAQYGASAGSMIQRVLDAEGELDVLGGSGAGSVAKAQADAALDATAKADAALSSAQAYADLAESDAIAAAAVTAQAKADAALASAQAYADQAEADAVSAAAVTSQAHADAALVSAKSYADQAELDAVATASSDATTKANAALSSAQSYADQAEADAIAAAAVTAQAKADAALVDAKAYSDQSESDAISAASADATAKSSAAQSAAEAAAAAALSAEASAQNAARNALRIETGSHEFSQDGYVSSMFLKAGSVASNESSRKFSAASLCSEITIGCSEAQAADCEFKIRVIGDDGSTKSTESLTMLANETFAQKSFSAAVVAGDRLSVESVGLCKDPHCAVEFSKDV